VEFLVAGETSISQSLMRDAPKSIKWLGKITHAQKESLYSSCSVFVLPTLSDGFALTQLEAMAHGLPVITTPNCGKVVENGKTGFIIQPRDAQSLTNAILRFVEDPGMAKTMSPLCREAVKRFSIAAYGQRLQDITNHYISTGRI
jgi:glycosyltransferase involved in cell wall biosynthesis